MAAEGYARAFMTLQLRVDKRQAQRDLESLDAGPAGTKAGKSFSAGMGREVETGLRDSAAKMVRESDQAGKQSGEASGRSFSQAFGQLTKGVAVNFWQGATAGHAEYRRRLTTDMTAAGKDAGDQAGKGFSATFLSHLRNVGKAAGPNILGLNVLGKGGAIAGAAGLGLGALPAVAGIGGALGVAGAGAGVAGAGFGIVQSQVSPLLQKRTQAQQALQSATTPAQQKTAQANLANVNQQIGQLSPALQSIIKSETTIQTTWEKFAKSLAPLFAGPVAQVAKLIGQLTGPLHQMFAGAATIAKPLIDSLGNLAKQVLPLLGQAFKAVAPLVKPIVDAFTGLLTGLLPGLITLIKAAAPAIGVLSKFLGDLGKGLGGLLASFAPVIVASSQLFGALAGIITGLLPVIGQLAGIFAKALAPAMTVFAGVLQSLMPALVIIGKVIADLAAAMLTDLVGVIKVLAGLFHAIEPALKAFATAMSGVFTVLENSGVFNIIALALESLAKPLGILISALLRGLIPILPPVIKFIGDLTAALAAGLAKAIVALLPPLMLLATNVLTAIAQVLPIVLPLFMSLVGILTPVFVRVVSDLAVALDVLVKAVPPSALKVLTLGFLAVWAAIKAGGLIAAASNPLILIGVAVGLLVIAIVELVKHWDAVWGAIKATAKAAWEFLTHGWGQFLIPGLTLVRLAVDFFSKHWSQIWGAIKAVAVGFWQWLHQVFATDLGGFFTRTIPHWFDVCLAAAKVFWSNMGKAFVAGWNWIWAHTWTPVHDFIFKTIPAWWDAFIRFTRDRFVTPWQNIIKGSWDWLTSHVWTPVHDFFTKTFPGWFDSAVNAVGRVWDKIKAKISAPIQWVAQHVLVHLFNAIDDVTNFVKLGKPLAGPANSLQNIGKAAGGLITGGRPGRDSVLAALMPGEVVVPTDMVDAGVVDHLRGFLPGFGLGGKVLRRFAAGGRPRHVRGQGDTGYDSFPGVGRRFKVPGMAAGGQVEQSMLNFMLSKRGAPYSEANRWGRPPWDCSSLLWDAAHHAGVPIPQSAAIANTEAEWFSGWSGTYMYRNPSEIQTGDILWSGGASPGPSPWGGIGHVGMAANPSTMISALGTAYGVTTSGIGGLTVGGRLGGKGGKGILSKVGSFFKGIWGAVVRTVEDIMSGLGKFATVGVDLAKGNVAGALKAMLGQVKPGAGGAENSGLGNTLLALPGVLTEDVFKHIMQTVKDFVAGQQASSGGGGGGGVIGPVSGPADAGPGQAVAYAQSRLSSYGWGANQLAPLQSLWTGESGWSRTARNPSSGAYGIPQALPESKLPAAGQRSGGSHASPQIDWGLNYIKSTPGYGSPAATYAKWLSRSPHWYADGTSGAHPGWAWVGERGPELVNFAGGEQVIPSPGAGYAAGTLSATQRATAALARQMGTAGGGLAASYAKVVPSTTAATLQADQTKYLKEIALYFHGTTAKNHENLVIKQTAQLTAMQTRLGTLGAGVAGAQAYQGQVLSGLSAYGLGQTGVTGPAAGPAIAADLKSQLASLRGFSAALSGLTKAGASAGVIRQAAAMSPDGGTAYANQTAAALRKLRAVRAPAALISQVVAAGPSVAQAYADALAAGGPAAQAILSTTGQVEAAKLALSRGAASAAYGGGYDTGANFLGGLKSQQAGLNKMFSGLGKTMATEAVRWFKVPPARRPYGYAAGGWINEPVTGLGAFTGSLYTFGERGREYITPEGQMRGSDGPGAPLIGAYHTNYYGTGDTAQALNELTFTLRRVKQGAFFRPGG